MQLIQIGEVRQKTVLELVQQMASRQHSEIEQLKIMAQSRARSDRRSLGRARCTSSRQER